MEFKTGERVIFLKGKEEFWGVPFQLDNENIKIIYTDGYDKKMEIINVNDIIAIANINTGAYSRVSSKNTE